MPLRPKSNARTSNECFYWRVDGSKGDDWIHDEILNNPEADRCFAEKVIQSAMIEDGMSREEAMELYGLFEFSHARDLGKE